MARPMRTAARDMTGPLGLAWTLALEGRAVGNSPSGGCRGDREKCKGRDGHHRWPARPLAYLPSHSSKSVLPIILFFDNNISLTYRITLSYSSTVEKKYSYKLARVSAGGSYRC